MITNNPAKLAEIPSRLSDVSWWMRLLNQTVAQKANREDDEVGKFWQARYRAVRLLDETALLACTAYVDLNPIRAAMAETIETSDFTSAQQRARRVQTEAGVVARPDDEEQPAEFLSPVDLDVASGDSLNPSIRMACTLTSRPSGKMRALSTPCEIVSRPTARSENHAK